MEHPMTLLAALGVVEWHSALRHLEAMRPSGDVSDTMIDIITGELTHKATAWIYTRNLPTDSALDDVAEDARRYLTENVDDLDALLAERI
jgi:hypothetical protein